MELFCQHEDDINLLGVTEKILKFYFRNNSRIVLVHNDKNDLIGFFLYAAAKTFFSIAANLRYKLRTIDKMSIPVEKCSVAIYGLVDEKRDDAEEIFFDMFKKRHTDAVEHGYEYSIVNANADYRINTFCKMDEWSRKMDFIDTMSGNHGFTETAVTNHQGRPIILHKYK